MVIGLIPRTRMLTGKLRRKEIVRVASRLEKVGASNERKNSRIFITGLAINYVF